MYVTSLFLFIFLHHPFSLSTSAQTHTHNPSKPTRLPFDGLSNTVAASKLALTLARHLIPPTFYDTSLTILSSIIIRLLVLSCANSLNIKGPKNMNATAQALNSAFTNLDAPSVYVGTFAKYNNASLEGAWLVMTDYRNHDDFISACSKLHQDEDDPEFMFQDYSNFPSAFYKECAIDPALWDWLDMDENDQKLLAAYQSAIDKDGTIEQARDAFQGTHESAEDFAANLFEETGELDKVPQSLRCHINWAGVARELGYEGWTFHNTDDGVFIFSP